MDTCDEIIRVATCYPVARLSAEAQWSNRVCTLRRLYAIGALGALDV